MANSNTAAWEGVFRPPDWAAPCFSDTAVPVSTLICEAPLNTLQRDHGAGYNCLRAGQVSCKPSNTGEQTWIFP